MGITYLNNHPYYFKFVLDQGYWPDGILTAPSDEDFVTDIRMMKEMGFNGCRKHQKVEDARFLYHADKIGFLVWGEMAAACLFTEKGIASYANEWFEILRRDYNHPSIIAWVPFKSKARACSKYLERCGSRAESVHWHVLFTEKSGFHSPCHQ